MGKPKSRYDHLADEVAGVLAGMTILKADVTTLLGLIADLADRAAVPGLDGAAVVAQFQTRRVRELELALRDIEDLSPGLAALALERVDRARAELHRRGEA